MKVLTFVIPAYNSEAFLDKCIGSMLLPEVLEKLEIIVVNDGSKDSTPQIAQSYCDRYPDVVRLISQENKGHGGALNTGCEAAQGRYLKVIDADDWVVTENLPAYIELLEGCDVDVVLTHYHTIDITTGKIKNWKTYPGQFGKVYTFDDIVENWRGFDRCTTFHGITYRTAFYQQRGISLSEHVFYEDHEFATYPCCHAAGVLPVDMFLYEYRVGDVNQSVAAGNQLKRLPHVETVLERLIREGEPLPESAAKEFVRRKIRDLAQSYLLTTLLVHPDKKTGRDLSKALMEKLQTQVPGVYGMLRKKVQIFTFMNRLHIEKKTWDAIMESKLYNRLRGNRSYE